MKETTKTLIETLQKEWGKEITVTSVREDCISDCGIIKFSFGTKIRFSIGKNFYALESDVEETYKGKVEKLNYQITDYQKEIHRVAINEEDFDEWMAATRDFDTLKEVIDFINDETAPAYNDKFADDSRYIIR